MLYVSVLLEFGVAALIVEFAGSEPIVGGLAMFAALTNSMPTQS